MTQSAMPTKVAPPRAERVTEAQMLQWLKERYQAPEWAIFTGVTDATGAHLRTADAIAMNLWPSRGLALHGFEVKVSRSDWLRELKDPAKAEQIASHCDFWWVAVPDAGLIRDGELPEGWGLLARRRGRLEQVVAPAKRDRPDAVERGFVAALLRRASLQSVDEVLLEAARKDGYASGKEWGQARGAERVERAESRWRDAERVLKVFADAGVSLNRFTQDDEIERYARLMARAVKCERIADRARASLHQQRSAFTDYLDAVDGALEAIDATEATS